MADLVERRIPWPRGRPWRPGEPVSLDGDTGTTYLLRAVVQDADPTSSWATVTLEPVRVVDDPSAATGSPDEEPLAS